MHRPDARLARPAEKQLAEQSQQSSETCSAGESARVSVRVPEATGEGRGRPQETGTYIPRYISMKNHRAQLTAPYPSTRIVFGGPFGVKKQFPDVLAPEILMPRSGTRIWCGELCAVVFIEVSHFE